MTTFQRPIKYQKVKKAYKPESQEREENGGWSAVQSFQQ